MGCEARIVLFAATRDDAAKAARRAFDRIAMLDRALSDWRVDGELAALWRALDAAPSIPASFEVSDDLAGMLWCALDMAERTDGRFDPTLGALTQLWRRARGGSPPSHAEIDAARAATGFRSISLEGRSLTISRRGLRLDFGAIGKGFAADAALRVLTDSGPARALVEIGGDGAVADAPPGRSGWRLALAATGEVVELPPWSGMATSGAESQWIELDGEARSHVIDPRDGLGLVRSPTVTVIVRRDRSAADGSACGPGAVADALATALSVADESMISAIVARVPGAEAVLADAGEPRRVRRFGAAGRESPPGPPGAR